MGTLHESPCTLMTDRDPFFSESETFETKPCQENKNTHLVFSNFFFRSSPAVCEIIWKYMVAAGRPQTT